MGGGGTVTYYYYAAFSGQNGGRVLPGQSYRNVVGGMAEIYVGTPLTSGYTNTLYRYPDVLLIHGKGVPGGGAGESGYTTIYPASTTPYTEESSIGINTNGEYTYGSHLFLTAGGGGGGWGAKGGDCLDKNSNVFVYGGAGGKAVQTNGYAVTWLGGSNRAYGAVG